MSAHQCQAVTLTSMHTADRLASPARRFFSLDNRYRPPIVHHAASCWSAAHVRHPRELHDGPCCHRHQSSRAELVLGRLFIGKWPHLASAYISGISVGILVRSPAFWPYALCALISIMSKYVLRVQGRHLWNPSNFGVCAMLVPRCRHRRQPQHPVGQLSVWPMVVIWSLGSAIIWRLQRFHISATYVALVSAFAFLRSWITADPWHSEIAPITGPMYQLFIFFMITDPKTTVRSKTAAVRRRVSCGRGRDDVCACTRWSTRRSTRCSWLGPRPC